MDEPGSISDFMRDPRVRAYFLQLLADPLPDEEKYQKFVAFCAQIGQAAGCAAFPAGCDAVDPPEWGMEELLTHLVESLEHAARRMQRSQHQDGGWGLQIEQSGFWHSAYVALFLRSVQEIIDRGNFHSIDGALRRVTAYLEQHPDGWAPDTLPGIGGISVYDFSLMVRCFYRVGRPFLRREPALRVYRGLDRLYHAQNPDGGWDASLWGYEVSTPTRVWSEVGAVSAALQALVETHDQRFQAAVARGLQWLAATQNPDGSWNDGACHPALPAFQLEGQPSVVKTCDALQGLIAGDALDLPLQPYRGCVDRAVTWLLAQEKPVLERQRRISRWGSGYTLADYDAACLILETLLRLPNIALPVLAPYAAWLVQGQRRQVDDPEDGCWVLGNTPRIGLALAAFYRRGQEKETHQQIPWIP
jgi:hypothetical protein